MQLLTPLLKYAGQDISHWFNSTTGEVNQTPHYIKTLKVEIPCISINGNGMCVFPRWIILTSPTSPPKIRFQHSNP